MRLIPTSALFMLYHRPAFNFQAERIRNSRQPVTELTEALWTGWLLNPPTHGLAPNCSLLCLATAHGKLEHSRLTIEECLSIIRRASILLHSALRSDKERAKDQLRNR